MALIHKTLHGKWFTPTPVEWKDDDDMNENTPEGTHCFITVRGHMRMRVTRKLKENVMGAHMERMVTLTEEDSDFKVNGKANVTYDRIHFSNGAIWIRGTDKLEEERAGPELQEEAMHGAPEDSVEPAPMCGFFCGVGKKQAPASDEPVEAGADEEPPPPPADMSEGFFSEKEVEGLVERINDVVGIWGISEAKEAEFIRPPVLMMNKMIKVAMEGFLDNPIIELFQYLMDEAMSIKHKAKQIGKYLHDKFVEPLTAQLLVMLSEKFSAIEWMHDKVEKVVKMMSEMVTQELMSKSIEQINDAEVADCEDEA